MMHFYTRKLVSIVIIALTSIFSQSIIAQTTKIMGNIIDAKTKEPIPFVNVAFIKSPDGTSSDFDGNFSLETKTKSDTIYASIVGYQQQKRKVVRNTFQYITFEMEPLENNLLEVVIKYKGNPAERILDKIIENKKNNDRSRLNAIQYEAYNKIEFDANNISEKLSKRKLIKPFDFIFEYIDTTTINGKSYLPMFLTETMSDVYMRNQPKSKKEIIKATKISGMENESISQFLGSMYQNPYVYDNFITLFDKNFVSPIADNALLYYRYYLIDSTFLQNKWCYKIMFKPRRRQELTFTGSFWVNDTSFAIKKVDMRIVDDANINLINDLVCVQEFDFVDNQYWMLSRDYMIVDFNPLNNNQKLLGFFGKKTTTYRKYIINQPKEEKFYSSPTDIIVADSASDKSKDYWITARHDSLNKDERNIYKMIDSVQSVPLFHTYVDIVQTLVLGYKVWGPVEIGPYSSLYSFNDMEGNRFRIGGRSSNEFSTKTQLTAHLAYGTKDKKFKYGLGYEHNIKKNPRRAFGVFYKWDAEQLGQSENAFREDFLLGSLLRRNPANKLSMVQEYKGFYEHEWFNGFSNSITLRHRTLNPIQNTSFIINPLSSEPEIKKTIISSEIIFNTRFAYNEKFIMGEFVRVSAGTTYPVINFQYTIGVNGLLGSDYEYQKISLNIKHWYNLGTFGWSKYILEAGKTWGTLPYPLLKLHEGNETFTFDEYAFNMMNYFEFVSDKYFSFYYTHHFDGLFFNKVPLLRRLKLREVAQIKGLVGRIEDKNLNYSQFPSTLSGLSKPYFETSIGIENIFQMLRIDYIWRLSYLDHPNISKHGFMFTFQFYF